MHWAIPVLSLLALLACGEPADSPGTADTALEELRQTTASGNATAQYQLAMRYVTGAGVAQDGPTVLAWMRRAAQQGCAPAQYELGSFYTLNRPTQDDRQAAQWLRQAAEQGHAAAPYSLGMLYAADRGVAHDPAEAYAWLSLAADQDDPNAVRVRDAVALSLSQVDFERARPLYLQYRERYAPDQ